MCRVYILTFRLKIHQSVQYMLAILLFGFIFKDFSTQTTNIAPSSIGFQIASLCQSLQHGPLTIAVNTVYVGLYINIQNHLKGGSFNIHVDCVDY